MVYIYFLYYIYIKLQQTNTGHKTSYLGTFKINLGEGGGVVSILSFLLMHKCVYAFFLSC